MFLIRNVFSSKRALLGVSLVLLAGSPTAADVKLPSVFGDHMVLQQAQPNRVWGWAEPGEQVTVSIADQSHSTMAGADGGWQVELEPIPAGGPFTLRVSGKNSITHEDVLVGEVWICSGQSNMEWPVARAKDADLEIPAANFPEIRLLTIPRTASQEPLKDFEGHWQVCSPESVAEFSAVGYFFGRQLHHMLGVPIGLIDNSWGGSACEAWIPQDMLAADDRYQPLLAHWTELEKSYDHPSALAEYQQRLKKWEEGNAARPRRFGRRREPPFREPVNPLDGQHRPANLYNGVLRPIIGYGIRGVIWYQGESNAERAYQYRHLFPLMLQHWRDAWGQGAFPFYWVQLADYKSESAEPQESAWAELREAQTMALSKLPNTGQAVIIDLGEADDIHPANKQQVAGRLARWALARDYGMQVHCESPRYESFQKEGNKIVVRFSGRRDRNSALRTFEGAEPMGFAIAGEDKRFVWARARIAGGNRVEVWSDEVPEPVAVRYAWADNPVCNLQNQVGLPLTPFRTDDWPGDTAGVHK